MPSVQCPHCGEELGSEIMRAVAAAYSALGNRGRKRSSAPRCHCGASTLVRATQRGFICCRSAGFDPAQIKAARHALEARGRALHPKETGAPENA